MIKTPVYLFEDAIDNLHVYRVMDAHDDIVFNGLLGQYHPAEMLIKERDRIAHIAKCINDHETLTAQVAELKGENHGVDNSTVLKLIRFAVTGDMVGFARYARFAAEKSTSEIFRNAVDKYLRGEFGSEVIPMQGGPNE
jgi:hypothetical protein